MAHLRAGARTMPVVGWIGVGIVVVVAGLATLAPVLTDFRVIEIAGAPLEAPSAEHLLGTNAVGQDLWTQLAYGARTSLFIAAIAGGSMVLLGASVGLAAGLVGGRTDGWRSGCPTP